MTTITNHKNLLIPVALLALLVMAVGLFVGNTVFASGDTGPLTDHECSNGGNIEVADRASPNKFCTTQHLAVFTYIPDQGSGESSGTGRFDPFLRLQGSSDQRGYNKDGPVFDETKGGKWTKAIKVGAIPIVNEDPPGPAPQADYWEIFADLNETDSTPKISLNKLEIWFADDARDAIGAATQVYAYDGATPILINDVNQGSGRADLRVLIPLTTIVPDPAKFFMLYSEMGFGPTGYETDGGFDEWKVKKQSSIELKKVWVGVGGQTTLKIGTTAGGDQVDSQLTGTAGGSPLTTGTNGVDNNDSTVTLFVSEGDPPASSLTGYTTTLACLRDGVAFTPGASNSVTFDKKEFTHVVCTFTNTASSQLRIEKVTLPDGDTTPFTFTPTGWNNDTAFTRKDNETPFPSGIILSGTYSAAETIPATGWDLTSRACKNTVGGATFAHTNVGNNGVQVTLGPGDDVTCTFTNTKRGTVTIVKKTFIGSTETPDPQDFRFTQNVSGSAPFVLDTDDNSTAPFNSKTFTNVLPSTYTVTETGSVNSPDPTWHLTGLICVDSGATNTVDSTEDAGTGISTINLDPGETVVCTYTNTQNLGLVVLTCDLVGTAALIQSDYDLDGTLDNTGGFNVKTSFTGNLPLAFGKNNAEMTAYICDSLMQYTGLTDRIYTPVKVDLPK